MARILVDTSVWIDFLSGELSSDHKDFLNKKIADRFVVLTDIIRHEILIGARNHKDFNQLKSLLAPFEILRLDLDDLDDFDEFSWKLRLQGFRGKYTDVSIAYLSHKHKIPLMSFDSYFLHLAGKGILQLIR